MDREKVIKGLECAIGIRGVKNCDDCPYDNDFNCIGCDIVMRDAITLLNGQPEVVRCKDCEYAEKWYGDKSRCFLWHETGIGVFDDGFCNYGKKKAD